MALNGTVSWGKQPKWGVGEAMYTQQTANTNNFLVSASMPMVYQVVWSGTSAGVTITDQFIPVNAGDLINTVFIIEVTTDYSGTGGSTAYGGWQEIARIKKSRDLPVSNIVTGTVPQQQTFTIDVSRIIQDQLSYSLCPAGKGSWQTVEYGGMNGGEDKQDTVIAAVSPYIVKMNGSYRAVSVRCVFEELNSSGGIVTSSTTLSAANYVAAVNSVVGVDEMPYYYAIRAINEDSPANQAPKLAMTNCPNYSISPTGTPSLKKSVSSTDRSEFLQFYVKNTFPAGTSASTRHRLYEVYGQAYNKDGTVGLNFVLGSQWEDKLGATNIISDISHDFNMYAANEFERIQNSMTVQNVAPSYINSHAYQPQTANYPYLNPITPITANTGWYSVYVRGLYGGGVGTVVQHSSAFWYKIDDLEQKGAYKQVRFHWLNRVGGIDSYTAKGNVTEGLSVNKSLMESSLPDRRYFQMDMNDIGEYYDDSMRGYNTYKGGNQVRTMSAANNKSVYTEPLPYLEAKWLEELFTSPNVWVEVYAQTSEGQEYEHDAPFHMSALNDQIRPNADGLRSIYTPVIITNTEVTSVNQEEGLTMFNIQYSESQEIQTQRN